MSYRDNENIDDSFSFEEDMEVYNKYSDKPFNDQSNIYVSKSGNRLKKSHSKLVNGIYEWLDVIVSAIVVVVIIFTFIFRVVAIDGDSMLNTLHDGERIIISDLFYEPKRGDIVVISRNTENSANASRYEMPIIKRVIATAGETVDIDFEKGIVYVNGSPLEENYTLEPTYRQLDVQFPVRVPENCVFVLGDNRNDSMDSRSTTIGDNGMINTKYILGRAVIRIMPISKFGRID